MTIRIPERIADLDLHTLNALVRQQHPQAVVEDFTVLKAMQYGDGMVSTSARAFVELDYRPGSGDDLPRQVLVKLAYDLEQLPWPLYANEVGFYPSPPRDQTLAPPP